METAKHNMANVFQIHLSGLYLRHYKSAWDLICHGQNGDVRKISSNLTEGLESSLTLNKILNLN